MANAADHRNGTGADGTGDEFVVESPQVLHAATTSADDQRFALPALAGDANALGDLRRGTLALHQGGIDDDADLWCTTRERAQDVAQGSRLERGDDADAARETGQGALAGARKQSLAFELLLETKELLVEVADAGPTRRFDVELEVATRLVERHQDTRLDMLTIFQTPAE